MYGLPRKLINDDLDDGVVDVSDEKILQLLPPTAGGVTGATGAAGGGVDPKFCIGIYCIFPLDLLPPLLFQHEPTYTQNNQYTENPSQIKCAPSFSLRCYFRLNIS